MRTVWCSFILARWWQSVSARAVFSGKKLDGRVLSLHLHYLVTDTHTPDLMSVSSSNLSLFSSALLYFSPDFNFSEMDFAFFFFPWFKLKEILEKKPSCLPKSRGANPIFKLIQ